MTPRLSKTEQFVLERVSLGDTAAAIAATLGCSIDRVKRQRRQLLAKLGATNAAAAVRRGFELELLGVAAQVEAISDGQLRAFHAKSSQLDRGLGLNPGHTAAATVRLASERFKREIVTVRDLSAREANELLDELTRRVREEL